MNEACSVEQRGQIENWKCVSSLMRYHFIWNLNCVQKG